MLRWFVWGLVGCLPTSDSPPPEARARDVLVDAVDGVVIYRDGDAAWQVAPRVGASFGFDVTGETYAVAVVDVARRRVKSLFSTLREQADVTFRVPDDVEGKTHAVFGRLPADAFLWRIAGKRDSVLVGEGMPFRLDVAEGPQAIVAERTDIISGPPIRSLVVLRDVAVAEDLELATELFEQALPMTLSALTVINSQGCEVASRFSVRDTELELGLPSKALSIPHPASWQAGDHLIAAVQCARSGGRFMRLERVVAGPDVVPLSVEAPIDFGEPALTLVDERFHFGWPPYPAPVEHYEVVVGDRTCVEGCGPRWTSQITEGWVQANQSELDVISRPDLETLGLWDAALEVPAPLPWSVSAVLRDSASRSVAGVDGVGVTTP